MHILAKKVNHMIEVISETDQAVLVFPNEASLQVFEESGAATWTEVRPMTPADHARLGSLVAS